MTLNYGSYREQIPISSIIKFAKAYDSERYEITLAEVSTTKNFIWDYGDVKNTVVAITKQKQPLAFTQVQKYLESKIAKI